MLVRILTAVLAIPLFVGVLYAGSWPLFALVAGMGLLGFHEFARMWQQKGIQVSYEVGLPGVLALITVAFLAPDAAHWLGAVLSATMLAALSWVLFRYSVRNAVDGLVTVAGVIYTGWLLAHLLLIRAFGAGTGWDLGLRWLGLAFLGTWAADTFAYFAGRAFGKRKLAPAISPNKSVEGAVGGGIGAVAVGWFYAPLVEIAPWQGALLAAGIFVLAVLGDLAESALKRYTGIKDSGKLLPGHGGVLDRFDSSFFVLPFVYYVARFWFF